jgi:tight adherence protein C
MNITTLYYIGAFAVGVALVYFFYFFMGPSFEIWWRAGRGARDDAPEAFDQSVYASFSAGEADDKVREKIESYYRAVQTSDKNSIQFRLVRAGYFSPRAISIYYVVRIILAVLVFVGVFMGLNYFAPGLPYLTIFFSAAAPSLLVIVGSNMMLDRMGKRQEERYRRLFPDYIDMMIMCSEAGLSLEAASARLAREYSARQSAFGIHLSVMMLEVRAGKRLNDALSEMATRLDLIEARSLAVMFRQTEELGASIADTLRAFGSDMRRKRIIRAEEKALALPVKMVFPMGLFMFPVIMAIVVVPPFIILMRVISGTSPGG